MNITFVGDIFCGGLSDPNSIQIDIDSQDIIICNLEQVISDINYTKIKCTLYSDNKSINVLLDNNISIVNLANNHIQDKGKHGFLDMLNTLTSNGIKYFGAGKNIDDASKPVQLSDKLFLFGYCDYNKPYFNKIKVAKKNEYGVNPLSQEQIYSDMANINGNAILYFHWGKENVWFPPYENIVLAKKLLEHPKVHSIIGNHSHRLQGKLKYNNKSCYFSLGNFLFPDFYMKPRTQITYLNKEVKVNKTKEYHPVVNLTKKVWKYNNRVSLMLQFDGETFNEKFVKQNKKKFDINSIYGLERFCIKNWFKLLSYIYQLPKSLYLIFYYLSNTIDNFVKYLNIFIYFFVKNNWYESSKYIINYFREK